MNFVRTQNAGFRSYLNRTDLFDQKDACQSRLYPRFLLLNNLPIRSPVLNLDGLYRIFVSTSSPSLSIYLSLRATIFTLYTSFSLSLSLSLSHSQCLSLSHSDMKLRITLYLANKHIDSFIHSYSIKYRDIFHNKTNTQTISF